MRIKHSSRESSETPFSSLSFPVIKLDSTKIKQDILAAESKHKTLSVLSLVLLNVSLKISSVVTVVYKAV